MAGQRLQISPTKTDMILWDYIYSESHDMSVSVSHFVQRMTEFYWVDGYHGRVQHFDWLSNDIEGWSFALTKTDADHISSWLERCQLHIPRDARPYTSGTATAPANIQMYKRDEEVWTRIEEIVSDNGITINPAVHQALRFYWFLKNHEKMQQGTSDYQTKVVVFHVLATLDTMSHPIKF